jgi:hypothetical protein
MVKFEVGKEYFCTSACDHTCTWIFKVIPRTEKTVKIQQVSNHPKEIVSRRIRDDGNSEYVLPLGSYSMAPVLNAEREIKPETIEPQKVERPSNVLDITACIKQRQEREEADKAFSTFKAEYLPYFKADEIEAIMTAPTEKQMDIIMTACMRVDLERSRA